MSSRPESRHLRYTPSSYAAQDFFKNFLSFADRIRTLEQWSDETYGKEVFPTKSKGPATRLKKKQRPGGTPQKIPNPEALTLQHDDTQTKKEKGLEAAKGVEVAKQKRKKVKKTATEAGPALRIHTDNVEDPLSDIAEAGGAHHLQSDLQDESANEASKLRQEWAHLPKPTPEHISSNNQWDSEDESAEGRGNKLRKEWADLPKPTPEHTCKKPRPKQRSPTRRPVSAAALLASISPDKDSTRVETPTRTQRSQSAAVQSGEESQQNASTDESRPETPSSKMLRLKPHLIKEKTTKDVLEMYTKEQLIAAHKIFVGCPECFGSLGGKCVKHLATFWQGSELIHGAAQYAQPPPQDSLKVRVMTASDIRKRGVELFIPFGPNDTVRWLKEKVSEQEGTPVDFQRLLVAGKYYDKDSATREECGLGENLSDKTAFIVLQPQTSKLTVGTACDWCFRAVGGVCTRHLKRVDGSWSRDAGGVDSDVPPQRPATAQACASSPNSSRLITRSQSSDAAFGPHSSMSDDFFLGSGPRPRRSFGDITVQGRESTPLSTDSTPVSIPSAQSSVLSGWTGSSPSLSRVHSSRLSPVMRTGSRLSAQPPNYPTHFTRKLTKGGCPLCDKAVNGRCHRCLPVYKDGVELDAHEDLDQQYKDALKAAASAREAVIKRADPVWFTYDGEPCRSGTVVSVLFEDGEWRQGKIDAYHAKAKRVRVKFDDARIPTIHAGLSEIQMQVVSENALREEDEDEMLDLDEDEGEEDLELELDRGGGEGRVTWGGGAALRVDVGVGTEREGGGVPRTEAEREGGGGGGGARRREVVRIPHQQMEEESPPVSESAGELEQHGEDAGPGEGDTEGEDHGPK